MTFIRTVPESAATGAVAEIYERARGTYGSVPNHTRVFSLRPEYLAAWTGLTSAVRGNLDARRYELVTLAAALALRSSYCALAHGRVLLDDHISAATLEAAARGGDGADLDPSEVAIMAFAAKVATDAASVGAEDINGLRAHRLTDAEITDIAAAVAARCFFSTFLDALGTEPDAELANLPEQLRLVLTPGRPIAEA